MAKTQNKHEDHRSILLEWETPEFIPTPRGRLWYITAGIIMALFVAYGLLSDNLTMAIVFIMLAIVFMMVEKKKPRMVRAVITDMGVQYKDEFYPYHHINAFWLVYHPPHVRVLYLRVRRGHRIEPLRIELNGQKPQVIRHLLLKEVPEIEGAQELTTDILARVLKLH